MNLFIFLSEFYYHRLFDDSYGLYYYYTQLDNPDLVEKIDKMLKKEPVYRNFLCGISG